tara:strand:- start:716 stop:889 length:174 start_codon:yes stop_codon:yes gene_type:complete
MTNINDQAPSFELKNTMKESVSLDSHKGKTVILAFYPGLLQVFATLKCALLMIIFQS